jgi:hypothetical protein
LAVKSGVPGARAGSLLPATTQHANGGSFTAEILGQTSLRELMRLAVAQINEWGSSEAGDKGGSPRFVYLDGVGPATAFRQVQRSLGNSSTQIDWLIRPSA